MTFPIPVVSSVAVVRPHVMRLRFADSAVRDLQYTPDAASGSVFLPLRDPAYFGLVQVDEEAGTVVWPNGLDLAPEALHGDVALGRHTGFNDITPASPSA